jgi:hypothetical protein
MEASLRKLLLDPEYWRPRLEHLSSVPRHLVILPMPELSRPGAEICQLNLRAHDGTQLLALLVRPAFCVSGAAVRLRKCSEGEAAEPDWNFVESGGTDLCFTFQSGRRLQDRVLDIVRLSRAACCMESVNCSSLTLGEEEATQDEFLIARWLRNEGWIEGRPGPGGPR